MKKGWIVILLILTAAGSCLAGCSKEEEEGSLELVRVSACEQNRSLGKLLLDE